MERKILIVDDVAMNRQILRVGLSQGYSILEAGDGKEALRVIRACYKSISAVLLDIVMPVMDGFEVLRQMRGDSLLANIPVIVVTSAEDEDSRVKAFSFGANDFITKPYNLDIIKHCLRNNIALHETSAIINAVQKDKLTGVYNREFFFEKVEELVKCHEPGYYILSCFDIDNFKLFNDQYGSVEGDRILKYIGKTLAETTERVGGACGRVSGDNFASLYPNRTDTIDYITKNYNPNNWPTDIPTNLVISVGRYVVTDRSLTASAIYDRAYIAKRSVKGRYDEHMAYFDDSMLQALQKEQGIIADMDAAIVGRQFEVWFQPQYNHASGALIGAEALVRWRHPERGLVMPGDFIPVFERNGFVYELDKYVWGETCRYLRKWIDEGRNPMPVSVNISRYDVFKEDLIDVLNGFVGKYKIPVELLRLEITESAFAKSTEQIITVVQRLLDNGFTVEIDDFGSGYSSLNALKDVPAQIVKLDMRFLEDNGHAQRGGNILESVVRMAKWLNMTVIAEGVESLHQANYLKSIGCSYVQGYLYARPMPAEEYEKLAKSINKEQRLLALETVENLDNNSFWDPKSIDTLIFNNYVSGACILEMNNNRLELLRANDKFIRMLGGGITVDEALKLDWFSYLDDQSSKAILDDLDRAIKTDDDVVGEYRYVNVPGCPQELFVRSTSRVIASIGNRYLVYCINENITAQRRAEDRFRRASNQLQTIIDNIEGGVTAVVLKDGAPEVLFESEQFYKLFGYTKEQYQNEVKDAHYLIHPEDQERVRKEATEANAENKSFTLTYRIVRRDKSIRWMRGNITITRFPDIEEPVQLAVTNDITEQVLAEQYQRELLDNLPYGAAMYEHNGGEQSTIHLNKRFWELIGRDPQNCTTQSFLSIVHEEDRKATIKALAETIRRGGDLSCNIRILSGKGEYLQFDVAAKIVARQNGCFTLYAVSAPISKEELSLKRTLPIALSTVINSSPDMVFIMDKNCRYVCGNRNFALAAGSADEKNLVGKTDYEIVGGEAAEVFRKENEELLKTKRPLLNHDVVIHSADGSVQYRTKSKYPLLDPSGEAIGIYCVMRDITRDRNNDTQLRLINDSIPGGIATYSCSRDDPLLENVKLTYYNDGFCKLFGFTREDYERRKTSSPINVVFKEDAHIIRNQAAALFDNDAILDCVYRVHIRSGGYKWISHKAAVAERHGDTITVNALLIDITERQEAAEKLRISEEENRLATMHSGNIVSRFSIPERTIVIDPVTAARYCMPQKLNNVPYEQVQKGLVSPESAKIYISFFEEIINGGASGESVYQYKMKDGWRWQEARYSTIFGNNGEPVFAVVSFQDVTERLKKENVYKKWQQSLQNKDSSSFTLFRSNLSRDASFDTMEGSLLNVKFGPDKQTFNERTAEYANKHVYKEDRARYMALLNSDALLAGYYRGKRCDEIEYREALADNSVRWLRLTIELVEYPNSTEVEAYMMYENIDDSKKSELLAKERAETDPLTGLFNRKAFSDRVEALIATADNSSLHALFMMDLDGFKLVNDNFGHAIGDQTLIEVGQKLRGVLRDKDIICRFGGDEFMVCLSGVPSREVVCKKAKQICAVLKKSFSLEVQLSTSMGIAIFPDDGEDFDTLYRKADTALYQVKANGKDNYAFFSGGGGAVNRAPELAARQPVCRSANAKPKRRMLIADDNRQNRDLLEKVFENDFIIDTASDGEETLAHLRRHGMGISIVLLDLMMPGTDGFAVLDRMQESPEMQAIPVIVVSCLDERETSLKALKHGAAEYVTKPVDPELLRLRVRSAICKSDNEQLRAQNRCLVLRNAEVEKYRLVLSRKKTTLIEYRRSTGEFLYDIETVGDIAGVFDDRPLWEILESDRVAGASTVKKLKRFVDNACADARRGSDSIKVKLKTSSGAMKLFSVGVVRQTDEYGVGERFLLTFTQV